jgi:hypothetical protein
MGINDRERNKKDDVKRKAEENRKRRSHGTTMGDPADWSGVDGMLLCKAVAAIARDGGALRLGYSRDGGAYAVGIYGDGTPFTEYIPPSDDMNEYLKGLIDDYTA